MHAPQTHYCYYPPFSQVQATEMVLELDNWFGQDMKHPLFQAAVLLIMGIGRRKHLTDLAKVSGYPKDFVRLVLGNLRKSGIWRGEDKDTYATWRQEPLAFVADACVAIGWVEYSTES